MNKPDTYTIEFIERYLQGGLNEDELAHLEAQMKKDKALVDKIESIKSLPSDLYTLEKDRLANQVKEWMNTKEQATQPSKNEENISWFKKYNRFIGAAAILIFLLAIGYWLVQPSSPNVETRSKEYVAQIYKSPTVLRGSSDDQWEAAIQLYRNGEFGQMKVQMKPIIDGEASTAEQKFYFALAHLYSRPAQFDEALFYFSKAETEGSSVFLEEITWYRALIFIQLKEYEKARSELEKIKLSNQFGPKVEILLKEMD